MKTVEFVAHLRPDKTVNVFHVYKLNDFSEVRVQEDGRIFVKQRGTGGEQRVEPVCKQADVFEGGTGIPTGRYVEVRPIDQHLKTCLCKYCKEGLLRAEEMDKIPVQGSTE